MIHGRANSFGSRSRVDGLNYEEMGKEIDVHSEVDGCARKTGKVVIKFFAGVCVTGFQGAFIGGATCSMFGMMEWGALAFGGYKIASGLFRTPHAGLFDSQVPVSSYLSRLLY